jgi:hypothetical protein
MCLERPVVEDAEAKMCGNKSVSRDKVNEVESWRVESGHTARRRSMKERIWVIIATSYATDGGKSSSDG